MLVATRSFDFYNPGTTLKDIGNSLDALKGGAGDGVVTTDSQRGIGKIKEGYLPGIYHTNEPKQFEPILQFLDEQGPEIEICDYEEGNTIPDGGYTNAQIFKIKVKEGTDNSGFCGINGDSSIYLVKKI